MKYLVNSSTDPYFNLALDEYCLENIQGEEPYFYLWRNSPSVIIGLNQNAYAEVNLEYLEKNGIRLARRVTGGGAVYHDLQNMNYTIVGRNPSPEPFVQALRELGVDAVLTGRNDIFVDGRKVSGYARRVSGGQEIIHGTLMYDVDLDTLSKVLDTPFSKLNSKGIASVRARVANLKDYLPGISSLDELQARLQTILAGSDEEIRLSASQLKEVERLAKEKFESWEFIYGRSRQAGFSNSEKLPCGTVEVHVSIDRGTIEDISFSGDYLFDTPSEALADSLKGVRYDKESLLKHLEGTDVSTFFKGTSADAIASLILGCKDS